MGENQKHGYRWDHTENALTFWSMFVTKNIGNRSERMYDLFLNRPCFVTEKYDGTNQHFNHIQTGKRDLHFSTDKEE